MTYQKKNYQILFASSKLEISASYSFWTLLGMNLFNYTVLISLTTVQYFIKLFIEIDKNKQSYNLLFFFNTI